MWIKCTCNTRGRLFQEIHCTTLLNKYNWPQRWHVLTRKVMCISLLPLRGLSAGRCVTLDSRKPTANTISTHTARRCCPLRPLINLSLLSEEERTQKDSSGGNSWDTYTPPFIRLVNYLWQLLYGLKKVLASAKNKTRANSTVGLLRYGILQNLPAFELQHRNTGKHQDKKWTASIAAATALIRTYRGGSRKKEQLSAERREAPWL